MKSRVYVGLGFKELMKSLESEIYPDITSRTITRGCYGNKSGTFFRKLFFSLHADRFILICNSKEKYDEKTKTSRLYAC